MNVRLRAIHCVAVLLIASACSQHAGALPGTIAAQKPGPVSSAEFAIVVPAAGAAPAQRSPQYISANVQSAVITVTGNTQGVTANLTTGSPGCTPTNGSLTCSIYVPSPVGVQNFSITLFSGTNGAGAPLCAGQVQATIIAGATNNVPVTLDGVVSAISIALTQAQPAAGTAATIPVTVIAKDASGATIVGPGKYTPAITLTDSDTSGATSLSSVSVASPSAGIMLGYTGVPLSASVKISATANGVPPSSITPAFFTPFVPQTGVNAFGIFVAPDGRTYGFVPTGSGIAQVAVSSPTPALQIPLSPVPDACAVDQKNALLYCYSFHSSQINVLNLKMLPGAASMQTNFTTDAPAPNVINSSNGCTICGIIYDPSQDDVILATGNGYELYSSAAASPPNTLVATIPAPAAESFGFYPRTESIVSPEYTQNFGWPAISQSIELANVASRQLYRLSPAPAGMNAPDSAAVDMQTGIAFVPEELASNNGANTVYLLNAGQATLNSPAAAQFSATQAVLSLKSSLFGDTVATQCAVPMTNAAIDSSAHLAFVSGEFCGQQSTDIYQSGNGAATPVGVVSLPATSASPLQFGDYAFANMPPLPDGSLWDDALDPHVAATLSLPGICQDCGALYNLEETWIAVVDLTKLLAAPRSATDPHLVDPSYALVTNGVIRYLPTGAPAHVPSATRRRPL